MRWYTTYLKRLGTCKYHILEDTDLSKSDKYLFLRFRRMVYRAYQKCHLSKPTIYLIKNDYMQAGCNQAHNYIYIYLGLLKNESIDCLQSDIYHEIGHYYTDNIIMKHNLYGKPIPQWYKNTALQKISKFIIKNDCGMKLSLIILGLFAFSGGCLVIEDFFQSIILSAILYLTFSLIIIGMILTPILLSFESKVLSIKTEPSRLYLSDGHYRYLCEEIADEFALKHTHNFNASVRSLLSFWDYRLWLTKSSKNPSIIARRQDRRRAYVNTVLISGSVHPSIHERIDKLIQFRKNGYQYC